jgi:uncharacterized protein YndB with AHSA1/START domain
MDGRLGEGTMTTGNRLGVTRFATPSDTEIVATRLVEAPREQVFDAWTKPEHVRRWMLGPDGYTMPVCEIDARAGGAWHFVWRGPGGNEVGMRGEYREVAPPERLISTEHWGDPWPETLNAFEFVEDDAGTLIICTIVYPTTAARDAALATGVKEGMNDSFTRLAAFLG